MKRNKFAPLVILLIMAGVLGVGAAGYFYPHDHTQTQTRIIPPAASPTPSLPASTSSVQIASTTTAISSSTGEAPISSRATSTVTRIDGNLSFRGQTLGGGDWYFDKLRFSVLPYNWVAHTFVGDWALGELRTYYWKDLEFSTQENRLKINRSGLDLTISDNGVASDVDNRIYTFEDGSQQYFMIDGAYYSRTSAQYWISLYRLADQSAIRMGDPKTGSQLVLSNDEANIRGIISTEDKLYILIGHGKINEASIFDKNGNYEAKVTSDQEKNISPTRVLPPAVEEILRGL